tara:strand:+ start:455 stop:820 length:366 start_codon:yes stop_codon:yes gene_type:complete
MCGLLVLVSAAVAAPVASNVVAAQRADSTLVDLSYDLSGADAFGAIIAVELSDDSGATYSAAPPSLSGDLGGGIANGTGKQIVWDAGAGFCRVAYRLGLNPAGRNPYAGFRFRLVLSEIVP